MGSAPFGSCGNGYHFPPATRPSLGRGYSRQRLAATCKPYVPQRHSGNVGWMTVSCSRAVTRMSRYLGSAATLQASHSQDTAAWLAWVWWPPQLLGSSRPPAKETPAPLCGPRSCTKAACSRPPQTLQSPSVWSRDVPQGAVGRDGCGATTAWRHRSSTLALAGSGRLVCRSARRRR